MSTDAQELYSEAVSQMSPRQRLRLAALILDLTASAEAIGFSDAWSEQDQIDLAAFALSHGTKSVWPRQRNHLSRAPSCCCISQVLPAPSGGGATPSAGDG